MIILLVLVPIAVFTAMIAADRTFGAPGRGRNYVIRVVLPPAGGLVGLPRIMGPPDASRPLVVIDPGHGGQDPGASGGGMQEKALTLRLATALREELLRQGGVRVAMTRDDDRYLMLDERSSIARRLGADLFLSIHADSIAEGDARGASVYTLSEKGSSQTAARFAARENQSDTINGIAFSETTDTVGSILLGLSQRGTQTRSNSFANLILREIGTRFHLRDTEVQSAAFVVLKSPDLPSALMETGYISSSQDRAVLTSDEGRAFFSQATTRAIRAYFARQTVR